MKNQKLTNPHDKFFKESFGRKEIAKSFIKEYLPTKLFKQFDLRSLAILKDSFVDKELRSHFSDILYQIKIAGKKSYVYLLFEHKSYNDSWIYFQLLRNMVKIWESYLKQNKQVKKLPIIVPIVIYHGSQAWKVKNTLESLFEPTEETKQYIPGFKSEIYDISHIPDDQIRGEILLRVHFLIQKYIFKPELFEKLHEILELLVTLSSKTKATEYLEVVLRYLVASVESTKTTDLKQKIEKVIKDGSKFMPTIAEKWIQEGIEKGKIEDAEKMISKGMTNADIRDITGLSIQKISSIRKKFRKN